MGKIYFLQLFIFISLFLGIESLAFGQTGNKYALSLDGAESFYVKDDASNHLDLTGSYTFECWLNLDTYTQYKRIFDRRTVCAMSIIAANGTGDFAIRFTERDGSHNILRTLETSAAFDMDIDTWYHVAVTYDATSHDAKLFINGDLAASENNSAWSLTSSSNSLNIGGLYNSGYSNQIDAHIDEVRVSNIARNISDMQTDYSREEYSSDGNTVLLMHLDDKGDPPTYVSGTGLIGTTGDDDISSVDYTDSRIGTPDFLLRPNYQSKATGNWDDASTWNYYKDGSTWTVATLVPDENTPEVTIQGGNTVTVTDLVVNHSLIVSGILNVGGDFINNGTLTTTGTIKYNGSEEQAIAIGTYNNLDIDNSTAANCTFTGSTTVNGTLNIAGDITIQNDKTLDCNGAITTTGDCVINNNGTMYIGSTFIQNGDYDETAGLVVFDGGSAQTIPSDEYYSIKIDNTNGVGIAADVNINSQLTISTGTYSIDLGQTVKSLGVVIETNGTIVNNGSLKIDDDFVINGSGTYSDNGTTEFLGVTNHTHYIASATFNNLIIANYSTYEGYIDGDISVIGNLEIKTGKLDMNTHNISLGTTGTLNENGGVLIGGSNGNITATRTLNNPSSENVGGLGAIITSSANLGATTITRGHESQENGNAGHTEKSILRYYNITPSTNTGLDATLQFNYFDSELNSSTESDLVLYRSTDGGSTWIKQDEANTTVNTSLNYVELTGIDAFSMWTTSDKVDYPLPIELISFNLSKTENTVHLDWVTASEINNAGFEIQRSNDAKEWETLNFVNGAGNSNNVIRYSYIDKNPLMANYYRLKQIDYDGSFEYSTIKYIDFSGKNNISIYPNPTKQGITINGIDSDRVANIYIFDHMGKLIKTYGPNNQQLDVQAYANGIYYIRIQYMNGEEENVSFIKK